MTPTALNHSLNQLVTAFKTNLNRRSFLKGQLKALLLATAGTTVLSGLRPATASMPDLAVATGDQGPAVRAAVQSLGGMSAFVKPGQKVVIKPNMSFANGTEMGSNTHPLVVKELVAMCKEAGAGRVRVLDNPLRTTELCIEGVQSACEVFNENLVHGIKNREMFKETAIPQGVTMKQTDVMTDVLTADVLIAAPTAKSHAGTGVSLSMKGMMGLIYNRRIMHSRYDLPASIVDLATLLKPDLVVVDATRVLSTNGPHGPGKIIPTRTIIASRDMVAADALAVQMFEWYGRRMAPRQVKHIRLAHERGLGRMDVDNLTIQKVQA
ncbi:MAG: DUF362 domain-containing protein [Deltaproteobacteria bacterium]|nr:DUF362 domain-containing protein [Deltaproteobacteria bacterium]